MEGERVLHMNGGSGETSYTNNSLLQRKTILKVRPILEESLKRMLYHTSNFRSSLKVADLGCSSGPNSLFVISVITKIIDQAIRNMNCDESPTLQIYLNDLFGNDFNNIFKLLPNFYKMMEQERGQNSCFVNATPGNFYGRLFPNNCINFFHSSYSLHWLSQAPKDLTKGSKPLMKGNTYITNKSPPEVYRAYFEQFERDFKVFLKSRSEELKHGGVMVLNFIGREKAREISSPWVVIGTVLNDMVLEGWVDEKKLDLFNLPIYGPTAKEVEHVIKEEGSFTLQILKTFKIDWDANLQEEVDDHVLDINTRAEFIAKTIRAVFEPLLEAVFGKHIMDKLFSRYAKKIAQLMEAETLEYTILVISITKSLEMDQLLKK